MLRIWADRENKSFRTFVRPLLLKIGVDYVIEEVTDKAKEGDVVLAFGKVWLEQLKKMGVIPGNRAIGSLRGKTFDHNGAQVMVTWDPLLCYMDYKYRPEIVWDLRLAKRLVATKTLLPDTGVYTEVEDFSHVIHLAEQHIEKNGRCDAALDLETVGTDYIDPLAWIVAISITITPGFSYVKYFKEDEEITPKVREQIEWFLSTHYRIFVYGANFKFDMLWMESKWGIKAFKNFRMDTTLVGSLLQENRSNSLNLHAKIYTPMGGYDDEFNLKYDKSKMQLVPQGDTVQYAGGDTDAGLRVAHKVRANLSQRKRLHRFYTRLLHPAQQAVMKMESRGMVVDQNRFADLDEELTSLLDETDNQMLDLLPRKLKMKHCTDLTPTRPVIVRDFLFSKQGLGLKPLMLTAKTKQPSTSAEHFGMFLNNPDAAPFIQAYIEHQKAGKTKSTYVDGFMRHLRADGKFHPSYMLFRGLYHADKAGDEDSGGRTGRTSCREPAYQTIPKHTDWAKPLRSVYVPPPGHVILDIDFSQGELRICACIADEKAMIQSYKAGLDLHLKTGASLNGIELNVALKMLVDKDPAIKIIRQGGKAGNFGLIYGMGAEGFVLYAAKSYGVHLTVKEAQDFIDSFFTLYPAIRPWHAETIERAHKQEFIESPLGRVRHLPLINTWQQDIVATQERQAINTGVQATLTDMGLLAMGELDRMYPDLWLFGFTHDSLSFYVPEEEHIEWAKKIKAVMENLPFDLFEWKPQLQFPVEIEYGLNNLAETVELPV